MTSYAALGSNKPRRTPRCRGLTNCSNIRKRFQNLKQHNVALTELCITRTCVNGLVLNYEIKNFDIVTESCVLVIWHDFGV